MAILRIAKEGSAPAAPAANKIRLYPLDYSYGSYVNKVRPFWKDPDGVVLRAFFDPAAVDADLIWDGDNTRDLGSTSKYTRDIFVKGSIKHGTAVSRLVGGATSFSIRNNANDADNIITTDAGVVTLRNDLIIDTNVLKVDTSANRVGINQAAPSYSLHVVGDALISTNLSVGNNVTLGDAVGDTHTLNGTLSMVNYALVSGKAASLGLTSSYQNVAFTEVLDSATIFTPGTGVIAFTAATAGTYLFITSIQASLTEGQLMDIQLQKNGTAIATGAAYSSLASGNYSAQAAAMASVVNTDEIRVQAKATSTLSDTVVNGYIIAIRVA